MSYAQSGLVLSLVACALHFPMQLLQEENQEEFNKILQECEWRFEIDGLPAVVAANNRKIFVDEVAHYYVLVQCKAMLDQLLLGLQFYEVLTVNGLKYNDSMSMTVT